MAASDENSAPRTPTPVAPKQGTSQPIWHSPPNLAVYVQRQSENIEYTWVRHIYPKCFFYFFFFAAGPGSEMQVQAIFLTDTAEDIEKKINNYAFSGRDKAWQPG